MAIQVVFCAAEAAPFAKVGGLGDVVGALPTALNRLGGVASQVILPCYGFLDPDALGFSRLDMAIKMPNETLGLWHGQLPDDEGGASVPVFLLENHRFSRHDSVYPPGRQDIEEDSFLFFSEAVFPTLLALGLQPEILHLHDWHTAAMARRLCESWRSDPFFTDTRSVLTLHNLAHQGQFAGRNILAEGIGFADALTTVSPTYAREIQTPEYGCGLDRLLREHAYRLHGILNGIDTTLFDPRHDPFIRQTYDADTAQEGKAACKADLQQELGLPLAPDRPLFGMVSRLVNQKGVDFLVPALEEILGTGLMEAQWAILGTGEPRYEHTLRHLAERYPTFRACLGFNLALAQKIYAGSDFFLMPSRFEPCGLGQLIAMRYGSLPVVRATGGLADTVLDIRQDPQNGNGINFKEADAKALTGALRAAEACYDEGDVRSRMVQNAMTADFGWETSAKAYRAVYNSLVSSNLAKGAWPT